MVWHQVGKDLSEAVFTKPNCTKKFSDVPEIGVDVMRGELKDGIGHYLKGVIPVDKTSKPVDVSKVLKDAGADLLISYMPVGSYEASRYYAQQALDSEVNRWNFLSGQPWASWGNYANMALGIGSAGGTQEQSSPGREAGFGEILGGLLGIGSIYM